jgi:hypothetical protein
VPVRVASSIGTETSSGEGLLNVHGPERQGRSPVGRFSHFNKIHVDFNFIQLYKVKSNLNFIQND